MRKLFVFNLIFICWLVQLVGQDSCVLVVINPEDQKVIRSATKNFPEDAIGNDEAQKYLKEALQFLYSEGYLSAGFTSLPENDSCFVTFSTGEKIFWAELDVTEAEGLFLNLAGYRAKDFEHKIFRYDEVSSLMKRMLQAAEKNGYPFAVAGLKNIIWRDSAIIAQLYFHKNYLMKFDTLIIKGNLDINPNYLEQYTGIHKGDLYNQSLINELDGRLREIPFATMRRNTQIEFSGQSAKVFVYLDEKKVSRFDFLIGILPNNEITGRIIITGEGRLNLENALGAGESINLFASKLESSSKQLQTSFTYPYLPHIPFGADGSFNLFLRDSTFLERSSSIGIIYHFSGSNYMKAFSSFYNSAILTIDTAFILATKSLPSNLDLSSKTYGLTWSVEKLDYKFNPQKGFDFTIGGSAGTKKIGMNNTILSLNDPFDPEFDFSTIYDSIDLKSLQLLYNYNVRYFIPIFRRSTILLQGRGSALINDQILENELFRLGGNSIMRGFDEQSLLASAYHIFTGEYRFLFLQNSFASVFFDGGYLEDQSKTPHSTEMLYGFGTGVSLETKAGIFGLSYALGSRKGNPVEIKNAKIHFGYINYF